jgi:hypothetical protein
MIITTGGTSARTRLDANRPKAEGSRHQGALGTSRLRVCASTSTSKAPLISGTSSRTWARHRPLLLLARAARNVHACAWITSMVTASSVDDDVTWCGTSTRAREQRWPATRKHRRRNIHAHGYTSAETTERVGPAGHPRVRGHDLHPTLVPSFFVGASTRAWARLVAKMTRTRPKRQRMPDLGPRDIHVRGHDLANHCHSHERLGTSTPGVRQDRPIRKHPRARWHGARRTAYSPKFGRNGNGGTSTRAWSR